MSAKPANPSQKTIGWSRIFVIITILFTAIISWTILKDLLFTPNRLVSRAIREARIAVLPFENHTDDPSLDVLGVMASDWIIQGLVYLGNVQIVSFENIQDNLKFAQNDNGWEQFAARTGAEKVLKGTYQLDGQELVFQSEVIDTETGQAELVMPTVKGPKGKQLLLVSQLQQKFATAFAAKGHEFSPGVAQDPPAYDAYQLYQKGTDLYSTNFAGCIELLNQAIQKDSSFFMPYLFVTGAYFMDGEKVKADSVFGLINRRIDIERLPQTHMQWYLHWKAILNKDLRTAYEAIIKNFEIDPKQLMTNLETGIIANDLNMPEKSVRILGAIDPEHVDLRHEFNTWWHRHYAHNLYRLGRYEEAEQILKRIPPNLRKHWNYYDRMAEILIAKHQEERLEDLMQDLLHSDRLVSDKLLTFLFVSERYGHRKRETEQNYWAERGLAWAMEQSDTQETNSYLLGNLYYLAGQFQKALPWLQKATREKGPNWLQVTKEGPGWLQLSRLGSCYLALGERAKAQDTLLEMDKWYDKTKDAGYLIAQAHLYARQNDKERAMDLIREAFNKAHPYDPSGYENDFLFVPLQGYPPFENFVHPKG